jgi:hypothetical protein
MLKSQKKRVVTVTEVAAVDDDLEVVVMVAEEDEAIALRVVLDLDQKVKDDVAIVSLPADLLDDLQILSQREVISLDQEKAVDSKLDC